MGIWIVLMGVVSVLLLLYPLIKPPADAMAVTTDYDERDRLFSMLADLEYDYHMDKIVKKDYDEARAQIHQELAALLGKEESRIQELRQKLEQEIQQRLEVDRP